MTVMGLRSAALPLRAATELRYIKKNVLLQPRSQGLSLEGGRGPSYFQGKSPGKSPGNEVGFASLRLSMIYQRDLTYQILLCPV